MANSNVRFYKLDELPSFIVDKHKGIFVHVTKTMYKDGGSITEHPNPKDPANLLMSPVKDGGSVERINFIHWLTERNIDKIASGLWFGGENGWELLSNETNSAAINAAIDAKIQKLDVDGYAQAGMSDNGTDSTLTIKGIQEVDGKIGIPAESENLDLKIEIDGTYNESTNKIATQSTVTTAIEGLDVNTIQAVTFNTSADNGNTTLTFKGIKEVDGKIYQGDDANPSTLVVGDAKLKIQIGSDEAGAFEVFSANKQIDSTINLDGYVFRKNDNNVISVITKNNDVSSTNPLVTQNDINGLAGAMHYRGGVTSVPTADNSTKKGDVWIVTTAFDGYEAGDMFIARADGESATFDKVQGNLTLGIGDGQIAKNVGALTNGNLVVGVNDPETGKGIKTVNFDVTNLTGTTGKNERTLTLTSQRTDQELQGETAEGMPNLYHSVGITDNFTIMGRPMSKSFSISSPNRSISIEKVGGENGTDAQIDLIWNTVMDA